MTTRTANFADYALRTLSNLIESAQTTLDTFQEELPKNPAYALKWADKVFTAAAQKDVCSTLIHRINNAVDRGEADIQGLTIQYIQGQVTRGAMYPTRSTSPSSNMVEQETLSAYARLLERFEGYPA